MATLPADRTKLNTAISNQQPSIVASSQANRETLVEAYDTIDLLNQKVDGLVAGSTLVPFPPAAMARQAVINGNFDVAQRGTSFAVADGGAAVFPVDRWSASGSANGGVWPTVTTSQVQLTPGELDGSKFFQRTSASAAGSGFGAGANFIVLQKIENGTRLLAGAGKKITVSFYARSSIAGKRLAVNLVQGYGFGGSPSADEQIVGTVFNLTANWVKYSFTFPLNSLSGKTFGTNNDDILSVRFWHVWGSNFFGRFGASSAESFVGAGNIDIAQVQVNAGDAALPFQPRSFAEELALCQRYYYKSWTYDSPSSASNIIMTALTTNVLVGNYTTAVPMRAIPTVVLTTNGIINQVRTTKDGTILPISTPSWISISEKGLVGVVTSTNVFTVGEAYDFDLYFDAEL